MSKYHDHRSDCPFKFASLDVCDCVEHNMLDRIEALTAERDEANKRGDAWRFRADIAEAKLAKAVEAASPLLNMYAWTESAEDAEMVIISVGTVRRIRTTLAEIEGEKT
jgi:hypothetical protein